MSAARAVSWSVALPLIVGAQPALAQSPWVVAGRLAWVEERVDAGFGLERFSGVGLGLDLKGRVGSRITIAVRGQGATVRPDESGDLDRRIGEAELGAVLALKPWWGVYSSVMVRAIANDAGRQRWVLGRIGAEVRPAFTGDRLQALGRLGVIPLSSVSGLSSSSLALDGLAGLVYDHDAYALGLTYGLERFAFTSTNGNRREEQLSTLTFRAGIRLR